MAITHRNSLFNICSYFWAQSIRASYGKYYLLFTEYRLRQRIDCLQIWNSKSRLADVETYKEPWTIEAAYLIESKGARGKTDAITYRHYGVPLARRFRVLKFYFLMRMLGIKGLQDYQRRVLHLAKYFESLVRADDRFVVTSKAAFGVFCFRQKR